MGHPNHRVEFKRALVLGPGMGFTPKPGHSRSVPSRELSMTSLVDALRFHETFDSNLRSIFTIFITELEFFTKPG